MKKSHFPVLVLKYSSYSMIFLLHKFSLTQKIVLKEDCLHYILLWILNDFYYRWTSTCYEVGPIWRTSGCQFSWLKPGGFIWYQNHSCRYFSCVNFILFVIDWIFTLHSIQGFRIYRVSHLVLKQSKGLKVRKSQRQFMVA